MEDKNILNEKLSEKQHIDYVFLFHGYTIMVMKNGTNEVLDIPLGSLEKILSGDTFFRIHRSYIVNLERVREMKVQKNKLLIQMRGQDLPVARRRRKQLLKLLGAVN